jgi:hypothetical protein
MIKGRWRVVKMWAYLRGMASQSTAHVEPVRRPADWNQFAGLWIAVKNGEVVATAVNSRDLVPAIRSLGPEGEDAAVRFVPHRSEEIVIGVG